MTKDNYSNYTGKEKSAGTLKIYLFLGFMAAVIFASMFYILFTGRNMTAVNSTLIDAAMEIQLEATKGHLWFEEIISGDRNESIENVYKYIDKSKWYATAMLDGGENEEGKFRPLKDDHLREKIQLVRDQIDEFRKITDQRWESKDTAGIGSEIDQKYDSVFMGLTQSTDEVETELQVFVARQLKSFQITQSLLIGLCAAVFVIVGVILRNLYLEQFRDKTQLISLNQQLDASNQQLRANQQQLDASNQQLRAANQQLDASNQQLRANEQQLRAANQQLDASNQQLQASNQQMDSANQQLRSNEQALKASEQKYHDLAESLKSSEDFLNATNQTAKVGGWEFDTETYNLRMTQQINRIYEIPLDSKLTLEEAFGFVHPQDRQLLEGAINHSIESGEPYDLEFRIITANGKEIWANGRGIPEFVNGKAVKMSGTFQDITDRKNAEAERDELVRSLAAKNDELQSIVYISSHDLKSPLVNINGFGGALAESCQQITRFIDKLKIDEDLKKEILPVVNEDIPESLSFIRSSSNRMSKLIDGLLRVSRIGTCDVKFKAVDMNRVISQIDDNIKFKADSLSAEIVYGDLPACKGNEDQVTQLFANLIDNALKYLDPDRSGLINISGHKKEGKSYYYIEDNGIGIAEAHLNKIFSIFHRLDPEGPVEGEGLGLTIVRRIIDRHNGDITVESKEDSGTKFTVILPR